MSLREVGMMVYLGKSFFVGALVSDVFAHLVVALQCVNPLVSRLSDAGVVSNICFRTIIADHYFYFLLKAGLGCSSGMRSE